MPGEPDPFDDLRAAWRAQPLPDEEPDMHALETAARTFQRDIRRRNALELVAVGLVLAFFAPMTWADDAHLLSQVGAGVVVGSAVWIGVVLTRRGHVTDAPDPALDTRRFLAAHRRALLAQAQLLMHAPLWYVAPLAAGLSLMTAGRVLQSGWTLAEVGVAALSAAALIGVAWVNVRGARRLQARAEQLPDEQSG